MAHPLDKRHISWSDLIEIGYVSPMTPTPAFENVAGSSAVDNDGPLTVIGMPQVLKETVRVDELHPLERLQQQTVEVPMPRILHSRGGQAGSI